MSLDYNKTFRIAVDITMLMVQNCCTYQEADNILQMISDEMRVQREDLEYKEIKNLMNGNKIYDASDDVIKPLKI